MKHLLLTTIAARESSLPNQAKLKKKNLRLGKGGFYPRMISLFDIDYL